MKEKISLGAERTDRRHSGERHEQAQRARERDALYVYSTNLTHGGSSQKAEHEKGQIIKKLQKRRREKSGNAIIDPNG